MPKTPILALALSTDGVVRVDATPDPVVEVPEQPQTDATGEPITDAEVVPDGDPNEACPVCGSTTDQHDGRAHEEAGA